MSTGCVFSCRLAAFIIITFAWSVAGQANVRRVSVQEGRTARFTCDTSAVTYANFNVFWERDGRTVSRQKVYTIENVRTSDAGTYVCNIINANNPQQRSRMTVDFTVRPGGGVPDTRSMTLDIVSKTGENLQLNGLIFKDCQVKNAPPSIKWTYTWSFPDGRSLNSRFLYVPSLTSAKYGRYTCVATAPGVGNLSASFFYGTNPGNPAAPDRRVSVVIRRISIRNPMTLECSLEGVSGGTFSYEWRKEGQVVSRTQQLNISSLQTATSGEYSCSVSGTDARGQIISASGTDVLTVAKSKESKIALTKPPGPVHIVEVGASKELHCELVQSDFETEVAEWYFYPQSGGVVSRTSQRLAPPTSQIFSMASVSILVKPKMTESDTGRYECIVNRNGQRVARETFLVVMSDRGLEVYPPLMTYVIGRTRNNPEFHCQVDGVPEGGQALKWTFVAASDRSATERPLPANAKPAFRPFIKSTLWLNVENPTLENNGFFVCRGPGGLEGRAQLVVRRGISNVIRLIIIPGNVIGVTPGETARVTCRDQDQNVVPDWNRVPDSLRSQVQFQTQGKNRILIFSRIRLDQDGTVFTCNYQGRGEQRVTIRVRTRCGQNERECNNGQCISSVLFCDGKPDCRDGSDESDAKCAECEPNEVQCKMSSLNRSPLKKCIPVHWLCDGENDCGNNWDEENKCAPVSCGGPSMQCASGQKIPKGFQCDGELDCGSDENSCSPPVITNPSFSTPKTRSLRRGDTLTLTCEAQGNPLPRIVWRYNWGFVLDATYNKQCNQPNRYVSILTIRNVQTRHSGIYTCEALNNVNRAFSEDIIVTVTEI